MVAWELWEFCLRHQIRIRAIHRAGVDNVRADRLSREKYDPTGYRLHPEVFRQINRQFGPHTIDLMADRLNTQLPRFISRFPDPLSSGTDVFRSNLAGENGFRTSSTGLDSSSSFSGTSATGRGDLGHSQLEGALAPFAQANVGLPTDTGAVQTGSSFSRTPTGQVSALQLSARSSRLEDLRTAMTAKGFTKKIISHALKRWPRGSSDDSYWRHWKAWCLSLIHI